jgi:ubiquinone/menaquinone biosynthesis C-methylase UbiE
MNQNKVENYYKKDRIVTKYDKKRFLSGGGRFIDFNEKRIVINLLESEKSSKKILEVGAGTGRFSTLLANRGHDVTCLDQSEEMLDIIKAKSKKRNLNISLIKGDAFKLPFEDNTFDSCFSIRVLWHFSNPEDLIKEMIRVTKKEGTIVFDLLNKNSLRRIYTPLANKFVYTNLMTLKEMRNMLHSETIKDEKGYFIFPFFFYRYSPKLFAKLLNKIENHLQKRKTRKYSSVIYYKIKK